MSESTAAGANPLRAGLEAVHEARPCTFIIFGASGDLTRRKLLPALYNLSWEGLLHPETAVIGVARRAWSDDEFRKAMREGIEAHSRRKPEDEVWSALEERLHYVAGEFQDPETYARLGARLQELDQGRDDPGSRLAYLATPPSVYAEVAGGLGAAGLVRGPGESGETRIIVEKPFGRDLQTARALNGELLSIFQEDQIYRIDHYLGKETVQNILVFRLDNGIFEPVWGGSHVDHVQITVSETVGVGSRAGFYEEVGVVRDMLQNHLLQLVTLVAMEPPVRFDAKSVRDEKVKVLRSIRPLDEQAVRRQVVRGQYARGTAAEGDVPGYREEDGVDPASQTDTYLAARFEIDNWRWGGTPVYVRSGKRLPKRATEIGIVFSSPPYDLFHSGGPSRPNVLRLRIQPEEGISLSFEAKAPGQTMHVEEVRMDFSYATSFAKEPPEAYERLLLDAVLGDSTLFARGDEVELSWRIVDSLVAAWTNGDEEPHPYPAGTWGPDAAERLLLDDGRHWLRI